MFVSHNIDLGFPLAYPVFFSCIQNHYLICCNSAILCLSKVKFLVSLLLFVLQLHACFWIPRCPFRVLSRNQADITWSRPIIVENKGKSMNFWYFRVFIAAPSWHKLLIYVLNSKDLSLTFSHCCLFNYFSGCLRLHYWCPSL